MPCSERVESIFCRGSGRAARCGPLSDQQAHARLFIGKFGAPVLPVTSSWPWHFTGRSPDLLRYTLWRPIQQWGAEKLRLEYTLPGPMGNCGSCANEPSFSTGRCPQSLSESVLAILHITTQCRLPSSASAGFTVCALLFELQKFLKKQVKGFLSSVIYQEFTNRWDFCKPVIRKSREIAKYLSILINTTYYRPSLKSLVLLQITTHYFSLPIPA